MTWHKVAGVSLVILGLVGFLTVADDLRHAGELLGVGAILVSSVVLLAAGWGSPVLRRLALPWLALGILVGVGVGAGVDNMPAGIGLGAAGALIFMLGSIRRRARRLGAAQGP